jgi:hypothetical protein
MQAIIGRLYRHMGKAHTQAIGRIQAIGRHTVSADIQAVQTYKQCRHTGSADIQYWQGRQRFIDRIVNTRADTVQYYIK